MAGPLVAGGPPGEVTVHLLDAWGNPTQGDGEVLTARVVDDATGVVTPMTQMVSHWSLKMLAIVHHNLFSLWFMVGFNKN